LHNQSLNPWRGHVGFIAECLSCSEDFGLVSQVYNKALKMSSNDELIKSLTKSLAFTEDVGLVNSAFNRAKTILKYAQE